MGTLKKIHIRTGNIQKRLSQVIEVSGCNLLYLFIVLMHF